MAMVGFGAANDSERFAQFLLLCEQDVLIEVFPFEVASEGAFDGVLTEEYVRPAAGEDAILPSAAGDLVGAGAGIDSVPA
jgi:hypothetical protein